MRHRQRGNVLGFLGHVQTKMELSQHILYNVHTYIKCQDNMQQLFGLKKNVTVSRQLSRGPSSGVHTVQYLLYSYKRSYKSYWIYSLKNYFGLALTKSSLQNSIERTLNLLYSMQLPIRFMTKVKQIDSWVVWFNI